MKWVKIDDKMLFSQDVYSRQDNYWVFENFSPGRLLKAGRLLIFGNFTPRTLIQDRTAIRDTRVPIFNQIIYLLE